MVIGERNTRKVIEAVTQMAIDDHRNRMPEYCTDNTGPRLKTRLGDTLYQYREHPRNGDAKYLRSIYTAARFFVMTEVTNGSTES